MEQLAIIIAIVGAVATVAAFVAALWLHRDNKRRLEQRKVRTSAAAISAEEFQAKCVRLLDEVASSGQPLVITKQDKAVAKLVPMPPKSELFGAMANSACHKGDVFSAIEDR